MRRRILRGVTLGLLLAAVVAVAAGCGASSASTGTAAALESFDNDFVQFSYPSTWAASEPTTSGALHVHPMIYLSVQRTGDPCRTQGASTTCGWPVRRLRPGGVLIVWENRGSPGWTLGSMPGTPLTVGGRPARRSVSKPGACATIGADESVEIAIARPMPANWTAVTACLRQPNLAASERELEAVLASTKFKAP
jgi:hypothetical protein